VHGLSETVDENLRIASFAVNYATQEKSEKFARERKSFLYDSLFFRIEED